MVSREGKLFSCPSSTRPNVANLRNALCEGKTERFQECIPAGFTALAHERKGPFNGGVRAADMLDLRWILLSVLTSHPSSLPLRRARIRERELLTGLQKERREDGKLSHFIRTGKPAGIAKFVMAAREQGGRPAIPRRSGPTEQNPFSAEKNRQFSTRCRWWWFQAPGTKLN
jgi:hypothetical protein